MKPKGVWPKLGMFVVLTVGAAVAWGLGAGFFTSLWTMHFSPASRQTLSEDLVVMHDGRPLIAAYTTARGVYQQLAYRTLDGETVEDEDFEQLAGASLSRRPLPRRSLQGPMPWHERVVWALDQGPAPTVWYLIRDAGDEGRAYLAGYDEASRLCVGYIGREGFRGSPPPTHEHFALGPGGLEKYGNAVVDGLLGGQRSGPGNTSDAPPWCIYLFDGERVAEVDLRKRNVRTLARSSELESLGTLTRPTPDSTENAAPRRRRTVERLVVRMGDRVEIINPSGDDRISLRLPEGLELADLLLVYQLSDEEFLLGLADPPRTWRPHRLIWVNRQGEVQKQQPIRLASYTPPSDREQATIGMSVAPIPVVLTPVIFGPLPLSKMAQNPAINYQAALRQTLTAAWPPFVAVLVASAVAAWAVARRQRRYGLPHTALWTAAVFLTGVPGLIAYLIEHRRELVAACPSCGRVVPRKREACAVCGDAFPEPRLTGVEVFA